MTDEFAIQQTLNLYSDGASRRDWDQVLATFLPDGIWEITTFSIQYKGHAEIRPAMEGFVDQMDYFVQINSPAIIKVDGDRATAHSLIRECGKAAGRDEALEVLGYYDDTLARTDSGWKFVHRVFHTVGAHRFALLPGPALG